MNNLKKIFIRYAIILIIAIPNLYLFYFIFTPITIYSLLGLFNIFLNDVLINGASITIQGISIELIPACIAGAAYYLLFVFNFSVPNIKPKKRIKMVLFSFFLLLILNVFRIFFLSLIFISENSSFDVFHKVFWYFGSTIFVLFIWFAEVKIYNIKEVPFYSDIKYLVKLRGKKD